MTVESAAIAALVAVVRLLCVRVIGNCNHVVVSRSLVVSCLHGRRVLHIGANLGHSLLLQIGCVSLVSQSLSDALGGGNIESASFFVFSREETISCHGHKEFAISCLSSRASYMCMTD